MQLLVGMVQRVVEDAVALAEPRLVEDADAERGALDIPAARTAAAVDGDQPSVPALGGANGVGAGSTVGSCRIAF